MIGRVGLVVGAPAADGGAPGDIIGFGPFVCGGERDIPGTGVGVDAAKPGNLGSTPDISEARLNPPPPAAGVRLTEVSSLSSSPPPPPPINLRLKWCINIELAINHPNSVSGDMLP